LRSARQRLSRSGTAARNNGPMAKRSYGSGSLFMKHGEWYGRWWVGDQRVKRALGPVREAGNRRGLTRAQAEREMRRRMEAETVVLSVRDRLTLAEAGARYVDHLEHVMERKPTTVQDYRGYLRGHLEPYFGDRALERIDASSVMGYLKHKRARGLSPETVQNDLAFLPAFSASRCAEAGRRQIASRRWIGRVGQDRPSGGSATCSPSSLTTLA
jgi:Phage integrase, N-terminal SAM-like domain